MTKKWFNYNNTRLQYVTIGTGWPVVLIHGFAEDYQLWQNQIPSLSSNYQLIIPDLPGSGNSECTPNMSMESMAIALKHLLEQELSPSTTEKGIILFGHSMGGYVTLAFEKLYPNLVKAFGLIHSTAFADSDEKKLARQRGIDFIRKHGSYEFLKQSVPNLFCTSFRENNINWLNLWIDKYKSFNANALVTYYEKMMTREENAPLLKKTNKPVFFIIGEQDVAVPFQQSLQQCHLPQLSYIHVLKQSAHMGMWEESFKTNRALTSFLQDVCVS